jgi:hypothetical protein
MNTELSTSETALPAHIAEELDNYEQQIRKYRAGEIDETKMQKLRLHFGTYAQRQEGVQMQRIKIPGGFLTADQLVRLADAAERFGSGFMHFTTREDAQIYYVKLDEVPELLRFLAEAGLHLEKRAGTPFVISPLAIDQERRRRRHLMLGHMPRRCFSTWCGTSTTRIWAVSSRSLSKDALKIIRAFVFTILGFGRELMMDYADLKSISVAALVPILTWRTSILNFFRPMIFST